MDGVERRGFLLAIVENASKAHRAWAEGGDSHLLPEDNLYQRFSEISDQSRFINKALASDLERLFLDFGGHWRAFVSAQQQNMDVSMLPGQGLWEAWEAIETEAYAARMPELKDVEPLQTLIDQKVPERQMCMIYGFMRADGSPDFRKLREELREPGKHTKPETGWVAPVNRHIVEQIKLNEMDRDAIRRRRHAKVSAANTPAPESIESLVAEGVSAEQISKMKKIPVAAVIEYCQTNNLPLPQLNYEASLKGPKAFDFDKNESRQRIEAAMSAGNAVGPIGPIAGDGPPLVLPDSVDLDALPLAEQTQIAEAIQYVEQGMTPPQIAQHMRIKSDTVRDLLRKGGYEAAANA